MNKYKAVFSLKNGIKGEITLTANNDGDAFMTACKMFAFADTVEWKVEKIEIGTSIAAKIKKACEDTSEAFELAEYAYEERKRALETVKDSGKDDEVSLEELVGRLNEALDGLASAKDDLNVALNIVQK